MGKEPVGNSVYFRTGTINFYFTVSMKKIMFNDKYTLTDAVLRGTKTMTRRAEKGLENLEEGNFCYSKHNKGILLYGEKGSVIETIKTRYKLGEVVAVAQSYCDVYDEYQIDTSFVKWCKANGKDYYEEYHTMKVLQQTAGYHNKLFVKSCLMPHQIRITDIKIERLQEISDEDCLKEGVQMFDSPNGKLYIAGGVDVGDEVRMKIKKGIVSLANSFYTPRESFAALIEKPGVGRKGLWDENPYVVAYSFELIK